MDARPSPIGSRTLGSILGVLLVAVMVVLPAGPAQAIPCETEQAIFWGYYFNGQFRYQYGTKSEIKITDRAVNQACDPGYLAHSTAHIVLDEPTASLIEVGWREHISFFGYHNFVWFVEMVVNDNVLLLEHGYLDDLCPNWTGPGGRMKFKVAHFPIGSTDWIMDVDCNDGASWRNVWTMYDTGWYTGWSEVETGRFGGTATGMADDHINIQRKDANNQWINWSNMACDFDTASNWNGNEVTANQYKTVKQTLQYCPRP